MSNQSVWSIFFALNHPTIFPFQNTYEYGQHYVFVFTWNSIHTRTIINKHIHMYKQFKKYAQHTLLCSLTAIVFFFCLLSFFCVDYAFMWAWEYGNLLLPTTLGCLFLFSKSTSSPPSSKLNVLFFLLRWLWQTDGQHYIINCC